MRKFLLILLLIIPINVFGLDIELNSKSAIVINRENNDILYEKNINQELPVASLTKIMTTIVALENIKDLDEKIIIEYEDIFIQPDYVVLGLKTGMEISYNDLLYSTILLSAADSATALANNVFEDYSIFIDKMNELADRLGMKNTHFSNPVGYDDDNYSTSYDIYLLLDYALNNKNFYEIYTTKKYYIEVVGRYLGNGVINSINKYSIDNKDIVFNGTKTGFTDLAGLCFSGITKFDNNELLFITLGAEGYFDEAKNIVDNINLASMYRNLYSNRLILKKDKLIDSIIYNKKYDYQIRSSKDIYFYMDNTVNLQYLKIYYDGIVDINRNIKEGDLLGIIKVYYDNKLIGSEEVLFSNKNIVIKEQRDYKYIIIFTFICLLGLFIFRRRVNNS